MKGRFRPIQEDPILVPLYEGQLNLYPYPFRRFLEALREHLGLVIAGIDIGIGENDTEPLPIVYHPVDDTTARQLFRAHQELWRAYPRKSRLKPGDIYTLDQIISAAELANNPYLQAVHARIGVKNELVAAVSGPDGVTCLLRLGVNKKRQFTSRHVKFVTQLRPHLEKALQMHMMLRRPTSINSMLTNMANTLGIGFFILNAHKQVIQFNDVARRIVADGHYLSIIADKIIWNQNKRYNKLFDECFAQALLWRYTDYQKLAINEGTSENTSEIPSTVFRIYRDSSTYVDFLVQPVRTFVPYRNETSPHVVVYAMDSRRKIEASEKLLVQLYDLTHTEAQLAIMLVNGSSIADAAANLHLTEGSARTYSKRLYAKTGVKRQGELIQLLHKGIFPLAKS